MKRTTLKPKKLDAEKTMLQLVPPEFIWATGRGLTHGVKKYSAGNWALEPGFDWSRIYGGLQRHLNAFWSGEDIDPESGNHHLDHACCMLAFLVTYKEREFGNDDRIKIGVKHAKSNKRPKRKKIR